MTRATQIMVWKHFQSKRRNSPQALREEVSSVQFASIAQRSSRDISEGFGDTVAFITDDAGSPVLASMTASHFSLTSSHSLRRRSLWYHSRPEASLEAKQPPWFSHSFQLYLHPPKEVQALPQYSDL